MSLFEVELETPARKVDEAGWRHHAHPYTIVPVEGGMDGQQITGIYKTGMAVEVAGVTGRDVLAAVASDLETATDCWVSHPDLRDLIATLEHEADYDSPTAAYDTAVLLQDLVDWYWSLSWNEQRELQELRDEES